MQTFTQILLLSSLVQSYLPDLRLLGLEPFAKRDVLIHTKVTNSPQDVPSPSTEGLQQSRWDVGGRHYVLTMPTALA